MNELIPSKRIENKIYLIRNKKVMVDFDLAELYKVETRTLNQAVQRNLDRFPPDFMFQLTEDEFNNLTSQIVISSWGGRRRLPYVFTEQGVAMLSTVLRSKRAIQVNIAIMRAFVNLREFLATHKELAQKLILLEQKYDKHDKEIQSIFRAIQQLITLPEQPKKRIGFDV